MHGCLVLKLHFKRHSASTLFGWVRWRNDSMVDLVVVLNWALSTSEWRRGDCISSADRCLYYYWLLLAEVSRGEGQNSSLEGEHSGNELVCWDQTTQPEYPDWHRTSAPPGLEGTCKQNIRLQVIEVCRWFFTTNTTHHYHHSHPLITDIIFVSKLKFDCEKSNKYWW